MRLPQTKLVAQQGAQMSEKVPQIPCIWQVFLLIHSSTQHIMTSKYYSNSILLSGQPTKTFVNLVLSRPIADLEVSKQLA